MVVLGAANVLDGVVCDAICEVPGEGVVFWVVGSDVAAVGAIGVAVGDENGTTGSTAPEDVETVAVYPLAMRVERISGLGVFEELALASGLLFALLAAEVRRRMSIRCAISRVKIVLYGVAGEDVELRELALANRGSDIVREARVSRR